MALRCILQVIHLNKLNCKQPTFNLEDLLFDIYNCIPTKKKKNTTRKEGNVLFNDALNTFHLRLSLNKAFPSFQECLILMFLLCSMHMPWNY